MTVQSTLFTEIFALWPSPKALGRDMGLGNKSRRAHQWVARGYLDPWYWPRLIDVVDQRFGIIITHRQLVEAAASLRGDVQLIGQAKLPERRSREGEERAA